MFQSANYDVIEFSSPIKGMNQNISVDILPTDFAYYLENFIALPLGDLTSRYGTSLELELDNLEETIIESFPYATDSSKQIILYTQKYLRDLSLSNFQRIPNDPYSFSFTSTNSSKYIKDTPIKIEYSLQGIHNIYDYIQKVDVQGTTVTIKLMNTPLPPAALNPVFNSSFYSIGSLCNYDLSTKDITVLKTNLSVGCVPRSLYYLGKLLIFNGVDRVMSWDGTTLADIYDMVKEKADSLTRIDNRHLSFSKSADFNLDDYKVNNLIQIKVRETITQTTIVNRSVAGNIVTLTVADDLPAFAANNQTILLYQAWPPAFSYMYVAYDRIWALGPGPVSIEYRSKNEARRIYFSYKTKTLTDWFSETTKTVPSVDISNNHGVIDNIEAIIQINEYLVFAGRERTQLWLGSEPLAVDQSSIGNTLRYYSTVPTGIIHGNLIVELPNDIYFVSKSEIQSFSTFNIAKQFAATSFDALNPIVRENTKTILSSNVNYRACKSFKYSSGSIAGFRIGNNKVLCSPFSTSLYSWTLFSGDFLNSNSFMTLDNSLYLSKKNKLFKYADGNDNTPRIYGDNGGNTPISFSSTQPANLKQKFSNKRFEILAKYPSNFPLRPENSIIIEIDSQFPQAFNLSSSCRFDIQGDLFNTISFTQDDPVKKSSFGFRFRGNYQIYRDKLKFVSSKFWLTLRGSSIDGPITIKKIKLYGVLERK